MAMQTDVLMTQPLGATAGNTFKQQNGSVLGPCRIKGIYGTSATAAGTVVLYDGSSTAGKPLGTISTPTAANGGTYYILMPGEGVRVDNGVYAVITNVDSALLIYG
jgi:hypothetical protein